MTAIPTAPATAAEPAFHSLAAMPPASPLLAAVTAACRIDEHAAVSALLATQGQPDPTRAQALALARRLVTRLREGRRQASGVAALMHEFSLSSQEGVALMCLAEALLRIPDGATRDRLIADKIGRGDWRRHIGASPSLFVNAAAWGLLITGKLVATHSEQGMSAVLARLLARGGEPVVRAGMDYAMRLLGQQFVCGQTIDEALANSRPMEARGYCYSYDMLGEAALTAHDAQGYFAAYETAIHAIGTHAGGRGSRNGPGISIKLSALHPRYAAAQRERVLAELLPRLRALALLARQYDIGLNIDAEEAERLELSLALFERLAFDAALKGFDGLGFVVQAYQKRCPTVIDWLSDLGRRSGQRFMLRLVKGAYWDSEIKRAQVEGLDDYPVFTRKEHTDLSYLVCARKLLQAGDVFYPQFATHNAHTLATIHHWAQEMGVQDLEFQCLHGMGEPLYDQVVGSQGLGRACRIYAPVGSHETLLAYLVRRLLENGANSSFVNRLVDEKIPVEALLADPFEQARQSGAAPHPAIPLPAALYGAQRRNSQGVDLNSDAALARLAAQLQPWSRTCWQVGAMQAGASQARAVRNPANHDDIVARVVDANPAEVGQAVETAFTARAAWAQRGAQQRGQVLQRAADLVQANMPELLALIVREAGRTLPAAVGEVREAVDFLRYYALQAGEVDACAPLGTVACISPWNFPLAIFIGQVSAALAAGNAVLAKPAEQTPATAALAVRLLHEAGVPPDVLHLLPGAGATVGAAIVADRRVDGVMFTGSTEVAAGLQATLLRRAADENRAIPLVAETGGLNAMVVDSSALPEQVVQDALVSAFDSAGQRCSALRVLCLQEDIAARVCRMLYGALAEWKVGAPDRLDTDVGPVIDEDARLQLQQHVDAMRARGLPVWQLPLSPPLLPPLSPPLPPGAWFAPTVIEIGSMADVQREVFGPVLHILRYRSDGLPALLAKIGESGYGLTFGIQTRIDETIDAAVAGAAAGNIYVNRNMIGAVVGVQPFGGMGKSGTGPKAGGPHYLRRLVHEANEDGVVIDLPLALPGPTGEANALADRPRGAVLCLSQDPALLARMLALVTETGNTPLLAQPGASAEDGRLAQLCAPPAVAMVLADAPFLAQIAAMEFPGGAPLVYPVINARLPPRWMMRAEQVVSINTAAAGGNAALMTL